MRTIGIYRGQAGRGAVARVVNQVQEKKWKLYYVNTLHPQLADDKSFQPTTQSMMSEEFDSRGDALVKACEYRVRSSYRVDRIENPEGTTVLDRAAMDTLWAALP